MPYLFGDRFFRHKFSLVSIKLNAHILIICWECAGLFWELNKRINPVPNVSRAIPTKNQQLNYIIHSNGTYSSKLFAQSKKETTDEDINDASC